jgi:hypothetical protein
MHTLLPRNWHAPESGRQKFLAAVLSHNLSTIISRRDFEIVNESYIDLHNMDSDVADVIIYNVKNNYAPDLIIELCSSEDFKSTAASVEIISEVYLIKEAFIYNLDSSEWFRVTDGERVKNHYSRLFSVDLKDILDQAVKRYAA